MKEIDFLPEWYKSGKRKTAAYRIQYVILGGIFAIMLVWNYFAAGSVSRAEAKLSWIAAGQAEVQSATVEFARLKNELSALHKEAALIDDAESKIRVASVLAELSFLVDKAVVLRKVELIAERFAADDASKHPGRGRKLVKAARSKLIQERAAPLGEVRFKIVIGGVAAEARDVAGLICKLEESPYFFQVVPSFSRNTLIEPRIAKPLRSSDIENKRRKKAAKIKASEFEISCYLANYRPE